MQIGLAGTAAASVCLALCYAWLCKLHRPTWLLQVISNTPQLISCQGKDALFDVVIVHDAVGRGPRGRGGIWLFGVLRGLAQCALSRLVLLPAARCRLRG
jgi:hypothetical protein